MNPEMSEAEMLAQSIKAAVLCQISLAKNKKHEAHLALCQATSQLEALEPIHDQISKEIEKIQSGPIVKQ